MDRLINYATCRHTKTKSGNSEKGGIDPHSQKYEEDYINFFPQ